MSDRILTEEELKFFEENALGTNYWNMTDALQSVINSHRHLLSANAELSFKNMKLKVALEDISTHIGDITKPDFYYNSYLEVKMSAYKALEELK